MRFALAQIDTVVGDIEGNLARCLAAVAAAEASAADLIVLPELALTGYPPEDLVYRDHFVDDNLDALARLASACTATVVVGFVDSERGALYNAAAVLREQRIERVYHKRRLPNYGVFDERRYFTPGDDSAQIELAGVPLAVTVCEDIWVPELAAEAAADGARVLVNVSASPFHAGKGLERERMLVERARDNGVWIAYCNLVGGQDELVFDGRSLIVSPDGEVVARGKAFCEDLLIADIDPSSSSALSGDLAPSPAEAEEEYAAVVLGLGDYARKNGFSDVVLGLSGGIDSALTAAIAADALGAAHVHGVLMPSRYSSEGSVADAQALADSLGIDARTIPIEAAHQTFLDSLAQSFRGLPEGVAEENIQARVRGTLLMGLSNKFGWLTLATGNKSELSMGYSTLYGDMVGGFAPLKDVYKTRVYELSKWRNAVSDTPVIPAATMTKAPSAELRPGQVDQDSLPPYEVLDGILRRYIESDQSAAQIAAAGFDRAIVDRVLHMTDSAEYKRRQGPLGVKITPKAFGRDRRLPVTNQYRG